MTLMGRLVARLLKLPPAETHAVDVEKNLKIPMSDGVVLLADHYAPRGLGPRPTLLRLSPYRGTRKLEWYNRLYAERGFQMLAISSRGAEGTGGQLNPFRQEREDARDIVAWLSQQDWFTGELIASGASYEGFTAWALAEASGFQMKALCVQVTSADFRSMIYPGGCLCARNLPGLDLRNCSSRHESRSRNSQAQIDDGSSSACGYGYPRIWHNVPLLA